MGDNLTLILVFCYYTSYRWRFWRV